MSKDFMLTPSGRRTASKQRFGRRRSFEEIVVAIAYIDAMAEESRNDPDPMRAKLVGTSARKMSSALRWAIGVEDDGFGALLARAIRQAVDDKSSEPPEGVKLQ